MSTLLNCFLTLTAVLYIMMRTLGFTFYMIFMMENQAYYHENSITNFWNPLKYFNFDFVSLTFFSSFSQRTSGESTTSFGPNHHYLQRIIDVIENTPLIALYQSVSEFHWWIFSHGYGVVGNVKTNHRTRCLKFVELPSL